MNILSKKQLEELCQFDGPTVCNAMEIFDVMPRTAGFTLPGMKRRTPDGKPVIGYAATAKVSAMHPSKDASEKLMGYYSTVREMAEPTIAVIQDTDAQPIGSFWGEVQATVHKSLGAVATITDGGVRDINEVSDLEFHMFSTEVLISHGYIHVEDFNCTVDICGLPINPGDLIFVDFYGVVVIPPEIAPKLAEACRKAAAAEMPMLEPCRKAIAEGTKPTMVEIAAWRKAMDDKRKEL